MNWTVRLTESAEDDFRSIVRWSSKQFGVAQARIYARTISMALQDLATGPALGGVATRDDIGPGLLSLHVARNQRKGRHFVMLRVAHGNARAIDVLRILHDAMDISQHVQSVAESD
jgi:toxin ParE1/3/4